MCKEEFLLVGSSTMVCQSDGQTAKWSSLDDTESAPVCRCMLLFVLWVEFLLRCAYKIQWYSVSVYKCMLLFDVNYVLY